MHVLVLSEVFPPMHGGSGRWLYEVYRRMSDVPVSVVAGDYSNSGEFDATCNFNVHRTSLAMPNQGIINFVAQRDYWRKFRLLKRLIREYGVTEVHVGKCLPEGWLAWLLRKRLGIPYLCYVHGEDVEIARTSRELTWMVQRVFRDTDSIIANSKNTRHLLLDHWDVNPDKIHVVNPGVDSTLFCPSEPDNEFRQRMGWEGRKVILTVGRLQKRKGHDVCIQSLPTVIESIPDVLYVVVGGGDEYDHLQRLVSELGLARHVQFLREISDENLVRCYQNCDLFALPNRAVGNDIEGFGMVLVEAQACGAPVVAGSSGGTSETMIVGKTGFVVDCTDSAHLASELIRILGMSTDALRAMGREGRRWVLENLDWSAVASQAQECFVAPSQLSGRSP